MSKADKIFLMIFIFVMSAFIGCIVWLEIVVQSRWKDFEYKQTEELRKEQRQEYICSDIILE